MGFDMTDWNYDTQKLVKKLGGSVIKMAEVSIKCVTTVGEDVYKRQSVDICRDR